MSINKSGNKSCAFAIHADVSPVKVLLPQENVEGLVELAQACLQALQSSPQEPEMLSSQAQMAPLDGSVVLLQKSLGSLSETATPVSYNRGVPESREGDPNSRQISLWMQWTLPSCCLVLELETQQRVTFALEDISLSFDGQATYTKVKLRMRTLHSRVEVRGQQAEYEPAPFPSCILSTRTGFLSRLATVSRTDGSGESAGLEDPAEISGQYSAGFSFTLTR